ncbi:unnamed protein product, partial [Didymodactylos carnosus]
TMSGKLTVEQHLARFIPVEISADLSQLNSNQLKAIIKLIEACKLFDQLYIRQVWSGNEEMYRNLLEKSKNNEEDGLLLQLFYISRGPWDRFTASEPFVSGVEERPKNANFYPKDMTKIEFEQWIETLSKDDRYQATGFYHIIQRNAKTNKLECIPYSEAYQDLLTPISRLLEEAADLIDEKSLKKFLKLRARSFQTNDYIESEVAWLNIEPNCPIEVTCGPYETYTDELFSYKAAFGMHVHIRDQPYTEKLNFFTESLSIIESHLPVPDEYRNKELKSVPIVVVNEIFNGGDAPLPMTVAYNLPNDEQIIKQFGSKLTIMKNIQEGKYVT